MSILIFIVILMVLILVHEAGHLFTAKSFKIRVDEFGFGFPPKIFGWKKGETEYSINALPFGGFVKIFGEDMDEADFVEVGFIDKEETQEKIERATRSLVSKPKYQQALVMFAGIFANFLLAWLLFSFGFMSGLPTSAGTEVKGYQLRDKHLTVVSVIQKSPADLSGLKSGDKIMSVKSGQDFITEINSANLKSFIVSHPEKEIEINYLRGKENGTAKVIPIVGTVDEKPGIGISMDEIGTMKLPILPALWEGMKLDWSMAKGTVVGISELIWNGIRGKGSLSSVSGPVGMVGMVKDVSKFGLAYVLSFAALLSVNLSIINLIPFPALDGGRLLFLLIEKIKGSRIKPRIANLANTIGFSVLIILMLLITFHDVIKLF